MDDGFFTTPYSLMDWDYMDELFLEGCWLETADGSDFLHHSPSNSGALFDPSFKWPTFEVNNGDSIGNLSRKDSLEDEQKLSLPENLCISQTREQNPAKTETLGENINDLGCSRQFENYSVEGSELSRKWRIGLRANNGPASSVTERLVRALGYLKDCTRDGNVLIQIWVPVNKNGRRVLTTNDQSFSLGLNCPRLASYRDISVSYQFPTEEDSKEIVGLPGRVFMGKVPEWTPDVRFFKREEYPRVGHAQQYDVRGTLAVPVFEQGSRSCMGVIEVVMTTQKTNYSQELESVCKALKAVDLRSSEVSNTPDVKKVLFQPVCHSSYQSALREILEVLRSACGIHRLPLAQTWVPCIQQAKGGCRHSDENFGHCVSTLDSACYIADLSVRDFHEACSEHHLLKGQGVAGRAFTTNRPSFSPDVTSYTKSEYPLSHHARIFGLRAAVALRLRSIYSDTVDFVLEFFLPVGCRDREQQKEVLTSLSVIIQKVCQSLRVITDKELQEESFHPFRRVTFSSHSRLRREKQEVDHPQSASSFCENCTGRNMEAAYKRDYAVPLFQIGKPRELSTEKALDFRQQQYDVDTRATVNYAGDCYTSGECSFLNVGKTGERKHGKAEKTATLQMLQQYFAGSLKDAAKSIGVCPTTLKRICRQHGIERWPSQKIKKVGDSIKKIRLVMDSGQGAFGALPIECFHSNFPELASPNLTKTTAFSSSKPDGDPKAFNRKPEGGTFKPEAAAPKSPSSAYSQSSCSSQHCSTKPHPHEPIATENSSDGVLKRSTSDAKLHALSDEPQKFLPRSQSHISLRDHPKSGDLQSIPKNTTNGNGQGGGTQRMKVTHGEEKIRFRMQNNWGYKDLMQEIARRFRIDDTSGFHVKYLDDDSEWVLLTCDADLEECIDIYRPSRNHTIKLSLL